ncbi:MAG: hypothetical protein M3Y33_21515 [Actinomycetota bacterium]|nr:hypothetical protein [Actinomycetota bacterium]
MRLTPGIGRATVRRRWRPRPPRNPVARAPVAWDRIGQAGQTRRERMNQAMPAPPAPAAPPRRSDAGTVRLTGRDIAGLVLCGDM